MLTGIGCEDAEIPWWPVAEHLLHGRLLLVVQAVLDEWYITVVDFIQWQLTKMKSEACDANV